MICGIHVSTARERGNRRVAHVGRLLPRIVFHYVALLFPSSFYRPLQTRSNIARMSTVIFRNTIHRTATLKSYPISTVVQLTNTVPRGVLTIVRQINRPLFRENILLIGFATRPVSRE
ncbi:hypothetical protein PUN28_016780 [Cardiocondyla obscurior]|uniref:Uncharacterized protein n=1 Tax=Cardiocondyla obscurior TaxID=286306 RepID=A0AAW2EQU5_9HYME